MPGFQLTSYPAQQLWGPGAWDELIGSLDEFLDDSPTDRVLFLDRTFYLRVTATGGIEFPRDKADVLITETDDDSAIWHVVRADFPMDALVLIRDGEHRADTDRSPYADVISKLIGDRAARADAAH